MSIKSVGYQNITFTKGTYTSAALTLSPSLQILEIKSQVIDDTGDAETEYETLVANTEALTESIDEQQADLLTVQSQIETIDLTIEEINYENLLITYQEVLAQFNSVTKRPTIEIVKEIAASELPASKSEFGESVFGPEFILAAGTYIVIINFTGNLQLISDSLASLTTTLRVVDANEDGLILGSCNQDMFYEYNSIFYFAMNGSFTFTLTAETNCNFTLAGANNADFQCNINTALIEPEIGLDAISSSDYDAVKIKPPTLQMNPRAFQITKLS